MNANCVICGDFFGPSDELYVTQCGHVFHYSCLLNWLERSRSCPQCRNKTTQSTIHRVYFNVGNTEGITEDVPTLQNKLDNLHFQLKLREKDVKIEEEKYRKAKSKNAGLRAEVRELENKSKVHESAICALKNQITFFKQKAKDVDRLNEEIAYLKHKVRDMENVQLIIDGAKDEVNEMIRNENNIESLALLAATLKKSLLEAERRKRDVESKLKQAINDASKQRKECEKLIHDNVELRKQLEYLRTNYENEKSHLNKKIAHLDEKISSRNSLDTSNTSLRRFITGSPTNYNANTKSDTSYPDIIDLSDSLPIAENVKKIVDSDSPYLQVKSSSVGTDYSSFLKAKFTSNPRSDGTNKYSLYKSQASKQDNIKIPKHNGDISYDGFGGSKKVDVYPSPRPASSGLKRNKSSTSISTGKFRKLSANAGKNTSKVTNFFNQEH